MNKIINRLVARLNMFTNEQLDIILQNLTVILNDYTITEKSTDLITIDSDNRTKAIQMFFVAKRVEGCTETTMRYYHHVIKFFFGVITKPIEEITADDIRFYIAKRAVEDNLSKTSSDNELRVLKSFFKWCSGEGYISKPPTLNIKSIKQEKRLKKAFTETDIEKLRKAAQSPRDLAIIDVLYSTGARVSELCGMNKDDIANDEITVFGKGEKERAVYLNARAALSLSEYLGNRKDNNKALFVSAKKPYTRLTKGSIEKIVRETGEKAGVTNCHPHRFRRTNATLALNRGMPIEQVSQMLGHSNIETTTIYARSEEENVRASHKKYVV